jgi:hypothetical protein
MTSNTAAVIRIISPIAGIHVARYKKELLLRSLVDFQGILLADIWTRPLYDKYLLTYLLTPWRRILFKKLIVAQNIKKYPAFFMESEG